MAAKPLTKAKIIEHLAKKMGVTKKMASEFLEVFAALAYKEAKRTFTVPGIGKLAIVKRKARKGRNPATGETIKIPAKRVLKFRIAKACTDGVLGTKK
ncbi:MAG: HU family DNA-binding protein [Thermodesulfobacteriota bacterium]